MSSRSKQRSQERKETGAALSPDEKPPTFEELKLPLLGFSFYMLATGTLAMGLGQVMYFALMRNAAVPPMLIGWILPLGQVMGLLGLVLGWRVVERPERRMMAVAALMWLALFVLAFERGAVQHALMGKSVMGMTLAIEVAPWFGTAIVLAFVTFILRGAAKYVGGPTWPTLLGLALVTSHAFELTWPSLVPDLHSTGMLFALRNSQVGASGLLVFAVGLFLVGRRLLPDDAAEPAAKRKINQRERPKPIAPVTGLLFDTAVSLAGVTFVLCASVAAADVLGASPSETAELAGTGGFVLVSVLLWTALRRDPATADRPARLALAAMLSGALYLVALYVASRSENKYARPLADGVFALPAVLSAAALYATANARPGKDPRVRVQHHARRRLTAACTASAMTLLVIGLLMHDPPDTDISFWLWALASVVAFVGFLRALVRPPPGIT